MGHLAHLRQKLHIYPALSLLLVLCGGITAAMSLTPGWLPLETLVISVVIFLVTMTLLPGKLLFHTLCFFSSCALTFLHLWGPWYNFVDQLPVSSTRIDAEVVIQTPQYKGHHKEALKGKQALVASVERFRLAENQPWNEANGKVRLSFPNNENVPFLRHKKVHVDATVEPPPEPTFAEQFNFKRYLRIRGIQSLMEVHDYEVLADPVGVHRAAELFYTCRDKAMDRILSGVEDKNSKRLLGAMTLGYRDALTRELQETFLRSGTFHIFAISGLHTGIVAAILLALLALCPLHRKKKYILLPLLLSIYVGMTGGAPSAVRAWLMISVWSLSRATLHPVLPTNSIAVAAIVLLAMNPLKLLHPGFIFSFVIVFTLITGSHLITRAWTALHEKSKWLPRNLQHQSYLYPLKQRGWQLGTISVLAWLASFGLIAISNGKVIPAALVLNPLIIPVLGGILVTAFCKLLFGFIPGISEGIALLHNYVLDALPSIAGWAETSGLSIGISSPPVIVVVLYYVLLLLCLIPLALPERARVSLFLAWILCTGLIVGGGFNRAPLAVAFHGKGTGVPALLLAPSANANPVLFHTGGWQHVLPITGWLEAHGHKRLQAVICPTTDYGAHAGLRRIVRAQHPRTIVTPKTQQDVFKPTKSSEGTSPPVGGRWRLLNFRHNKNNGSGQERFFYKSGYEVTKTEIDDNGKEVELSFVSPSGKTWRVIFRQNGLGQTRVTIKRNGKNYGTRVFNRSLQGNVTRIGTDQNSGAPCDFNDKLNARD